MRPIAFVDLETSGSTPTQDRITEVGIVTLDGDRVERWSVLVNPEGSIPPFIERLTGISNEMVADAPLFEEIASELADRLAGRLFVAHNARFDYGFLKQSFRRIGRDFRATTLCTVKLSRRLFPLEKKHNLDSLVARFDLQVTARHRALADADLLYQFWQRVHAQFPAEQIAEAVDSLSGHPTLPSHLDPAVADDLPETTGVYLFYGDNDLPLYVGKSKNIRERVFAHFASDVHSSREMSLSQQLRRIEWIETAGEVGALLKEAALVKQLQPSHNRQLRRTRSVSSIRLGRAEDRPQASLVFSDDLDFGAQPDLYGIFQTRDEANKALTALVTDHDLCKVLVGLEKASPGSACFGVQLKRCRGGCCGEESLSQHHLRLLTALSAMKVKSWPFDGPALLAEGDEWLVIDNWAYLGSARSHQELDDRLGSGRPQFDRDSYRILVKLVHQMKPVSALGVV